MKRAMRFRLHPLVPALQAALVLMAAGGVTLALAQTTPTPTPSLSVGTNTDTAAWRAAQELPPDGRLELQVARVMAPADGRTLLRIDVRAFDANGQPMTRPVRLRIDTTAGWLQAESAESPESPGVMPWLDLTAPGPREDRPTALDLLAREGRAVLSLVAPATPGAALLRVRSGNATAKGRIDFVPELRPLVAVGLLDGVVKFGRVRRETNAPGLGETGFDESLRRWQRSSDDGERQFGARAAFYMKGAIGGDVLLTAAADSDKDTRTPLFRDVDPNQFYPVTGDASTREFDARSRGRLFLRLDRDKAYAQLGDFQSNSDNPAQRLAAYQRSLYGARAQAEQGGLKVGVFAAQGRQRQFVDEMPGRGLSGPYAIGQADALANSEQVEILVRDRVQPALVLQRRVMTRYVDYDFEPFTGRIVFRQPVPSVDEALNPVSIRVSYEVENGSTRTWVAGADAAWRLNDQLTLGAAYAQDDNALAPYKLGGVNATVALGSHTQLTAELAASRGTSFYNQDAAALSALGTAATGRTGQAARVELRHSHDDTELAAHVSRAAAGFQNNQGGLAPGRQEAGLHASRALTADLRARVDLTDTQDHSGTVTDGAGRRAGSVAVEWSPKPGLRIDLGLNQVREHQVGGSGGFLSTAEAQAGASSVGGLGSTSFSSFGFGGSGLLASPVTLAPTGASAPALVDREYTSLRLRVTDQLTPDLSLYGEQERADGDRQRSAVGADYKLDGRTRLYARHEFANSLTGPSGLTSDGSRSSTTALGLDTTYRPGGQIFSELRLASVADGHEALASTGVRQRWQIADGLAATTALERQQSRPALGSALDATAVALGAEYTAHPLYRVGGKLEWRVSTLQDGTLASLGIDRRLADDWTAIVRALRLTQRGQGSATGNDETQARYQVGLAYRDTQTNRWHALARMERRIDDRAHAGASGIDPTQDASRSWIASAHGNWQPVRDWTHGVQLAWKAVDETFAATGTPTASSWRGALLGWRSTVDIGERWDAGVYASAQQGQGARLQGIGVEGGYRVVENLWLSVGVTAGRHSDVDMFAANTSWHGVHVRLRFKFDESLFTAAR